MIILKTLEKKVEQQIPFCFLQLKNASVGWQNSFPETVSNISVLHAKEDWV